MDDTFLDPEEIGEELCETESSMETQPESCFSSEDHLVPRGLEFVQFWIDQHKETECDNVFDRGNINWDAVPKCLLEICVLEREKGNLVARNDYVDPDTGHTSKMEVLLVNEDICTRFSGTLLEILDGDVVLGNAKASKGNFSQHFTTKSPLEFTLLVDYVDLSTVRVQSRHLVWLVSERHITSAKDVTSVRSIFERALDKSPGWPNMGEIEVQSGTLEIAEWLPFYKGDQLNEMLKAGQIQKSCRKKLEPSKYPHISRWLKIGEYRKSVKHAKTNYVVYNAKEKDLSTVSELTDGQAFYIEDIEDLSYVPHQLQVPVTYNIDCSAAVEHLKSLSAAGNHDFTQNIEFLKFDCGKLYRVVSETNLFKEDCKCLIITGAPLDGKSTVLRRAYETCLNFACIVSAREIIRKFSRPYTLTRDKVHNFLHRQQEWTAADFKALKDALNNAQWTLFIDCDSNIEDETELWKIINVIQDDGQLQTVIASRNPKAIDIPVSSRHITAEVLCMSPNDKVELVHTFESRRFTKATAKTIYNKYEAQFREMPPLIWIAVVELYNTQYLKQNRNLTPSQILNKVTDAQIYESFVNLTYVNLTEEHPDFPDIKIKIDQSLYQQTLMFQAMEQFLPDFYNRFLSSRRETIYLHHSHYCRKIPELIISNPDFQEYLIDAFSYHVLCGWFELDISFPLEQFTDIFINRYLPKCEVPRFNGRHLNNILGYCHTSQPFPFHIAKFDVRDVILHSHQSANICRKIFDAFLAERYAKTTLLWFSPDINIAKVFRFLHFHKREMTAPQILFLCSVHFGFSKLFGFLLDNEMEDISLQNIQIRHRHSFRSVLHLLMYCSKDEDNATIHEKKAILKYIIRKQPTLQFTRDYYGNTPILEQNVSFELVCILLKHGANLEDADYQQRNLLDKNSENPEFILQLKAAFPNVYYRLNMSRLARTQPIITRCLENTKKAVRKINNTDVEQYLSETKIRVLIRADSSKNEPGITNNDIACYVGESLQSGEVSYEFHRTFLTTILATEDMRFKHHELCNLINSSIAGLASSGIEISDHFHNIMCQKESPFVIACLHGLTNIAIVFSKSFCVNWLDLLSDFELGCLFLVCDKHPSEDLLNQIVSKLQEVKYKIPVEPVQMALSFGSLNLFRVFVEKLQFTPERWRNLEQSKDFMALHHLLENSMYDSDDVFQQKKMLIDYITEVLPDSVTSCDKRKRTAILLNRTHNRLIRHLISKPGVNINAVDAKRNNILNVYLCNIIRLSEYLGESAYDKNFSHHDQVVYLAKKVGVNDLANRQIGWILRGIRSLTKFKTKALQAAGFVIVDGESSAMYEAFDMGLHIGRRLILNGNVSESEDEIVDYSKEYKKFRERGTALKASSSSFDEIPSLLERFCCHVDSFDDYMMHYVEENYLTLIENTKCSKPLIIYLLNKQILSSDEAQQLKSKRKEKGKSLETKYLYKIISMKTDCYFGLIDALKTDGQTEAFTTLQAGVKSWEKHRRTCTKTEKCARNKLTVAEESTLL